jgi:hypothetical protein
MSEAGFILRTCAGFFYKSLSTGFDQPNSGGTTDYAFVPFIGRTRFFV